MRKLPFFLGENDEKHNITLWNSQSTYKSLEIGGVFNKLLTRTDKNDEIKYTNYTKPLLNTYV